MCREEHQRSAIDRLCDLADHDRDLVEERRVVEIVKIRGQAEERLGEVIEGGCQHHLMRAQRL